MFDRLFRRGRQDRPAEPTCSVCGRTLLPGEWAQNVVHDDGSEEIVCSLCSQTRSYSDGLQRPYDQTAPSADQWPDAHLPRDTGAPATAPAVSPLDVPGAAAFAAADTYDEPTDALSVPTAESVAGGAYAAGGGTTPSSVEADPTVSPGAPAPGPFQEVVPAPAAAPQPYAVEQQEGDALWRALRDKDAEIARLQAEVLRLEAERQELEAQLMLARRGEPVAAAAQPPAAPEPTRAVTDEWASQFAPAVAPSQASTPTASSGEQVLPPAEPLPAPFIQAAQPAAPDSGYTQPLSEAPAGPADAVPQTLIDTPTEPLEPVVAEAAAAALTAMPAEAGRSSAPSITSATTAGWTPATDVGAPAGADAGWGVPAEAGAAAAGETAAPATDWCPACDTAEITDAEARQAADASEEGTVIMAAASAPAAGEIVFEEQPPPPDMDLLQRGVDLFNISPTPQKIAETSELLGLPAVNLAAEGKVMTAVFVWSMAWYEYAVDLDGGDVVLVERGYDERTDLRANGIVRSDGTIQVAPVPTRRPVMVQTQPGPPTTAEAPASVQEQAAAQAADDVRPVDAGKGDFIAKSLKGQRTDDEAVAWEEMAARDFDWGR